MTYIKGDFVTIKFDIYANNKLVQTTDEVKGKKAKLNIEKYGPMTIILGQNFILKALDNDILNNNNNNNNNNKGNEKILDLNVDEAYGKRNKKLIKTFPKSTFDEKKIKAIPGITYDFNGMYGLVKSVVGGRVMVDFNNPLAGKNIKIIYSIIEKVEKINLKIDLIMNTILKLEKSNYNISINDKEIVLKVPEPLLMAKEHLIKSFNELIPEIKNYSLKIQSFKKE